MDKILEKFRGKLNNGEFVYGVFTKSSDPMITEIQGIAHFDFIILDTEHGPLNVPMEENNIRSALLQNILPIVRVNEIGEATISKAFELGALGIMVPEIESAEAAKTAIAYARFYPYGSRGVCRFVRAAQYSAMDRKKYFEDSKNLIVILQLEGVKAIENIDEILAVPGIDIIFIGPYDLSASLEVPGEIKNPKVLNAMIEIVEKAKSKGITIGTFTDDYEMVEKWKKLGVQYISYSTDAGMFYDKCRDTFNALSICGEKTTKGKILDSTLRSGGAVNNYEFGFKNIKTIIHSLEEAKIDFIECGILTEKQNSNSSTKFGSIDQINKLICNKATCNYVAYLEFGKYNISLINEYQGQGVKFLKLAFHKKDIIDALIVAKKLKNKGYSVMLEPKNTIIYTDMEFEYLIKEANQLKPYAVYLSDSFGTMKRKDVIHFYTILERLLDNDIYPAFHAHNNLQLAFANAITILDSSNREFILDSSIYGMGRSAGNLNTELIVQYLSDNYNGKYMLNPIINVMDSVVSKVYNKYEWGYSLPNYLSANYNLNPSYASFLIDKNNLTFKEMQSIFQMVDEAKKDEFDQDYIESLYLTFLKSKTVDENGYNDLAELFNGNDIVVVAPGKSANNYMNEITDARKNGSKIISVNFNFNDKLIDYIFVGNIKRMNQLDEEDFNKVIATSNIPIETVFARVNYTKLLNEQDGVEDNSGLMLIKMLVSMGCQSITVYGMDGYTYNISDNYSKNELQLLSSKEQIDRLNFGLKVMKKKFKEIYNVKFKE